MQNLVVGKLTITRQGLEVALGGPFSEPHCLLLLAKCAERGGDSAQLVGRLGEGFLCAQLGEIHGAQGSATPGNPLSLRHAPGYRLPTALLAPSALVDTAWPEQERIAETDIGLTRMR